MRMYAAWKKDGMQGMALVASAGALRLLPDAEGISAVEASEDAPLVPVRSGPPVWAARVQDLKEVSERLPPSARLAADLVSEGADPFGENGCVLCDIMAAAPDVLEAVAGACAASGRRKTPVGTELIMAAAGLGERGVAQLLKACALHPKALAASAAQAAAFGMAEGAAALGRAALDAGLDGLHAETLGKALEGTPEARQLAMSMVMDSRRWGRS